MKLKENDKIPNSEIFVIEGGDPVKKGIEEYLKSKKDYVNHFYKIHVSSILNITEVNIWKLIK